MKTINKSYPAKNCSYGGTRATSAILYIVVHYTGNKTDKAVNNAKYFCQTNERQAGAHYFVDENEIYQSVVDERIAYAVGGSKYSDCAKAGGGSMYGKITNTNSISIEMCSTNSQITDATISNTIDLINYLRKKYPSIKGVYRHFDVNGKSCPGWAGWIDSTATKWQAFKSKLTTTTTTKTSTTSTTSYYPKYTGTSTSIVVALGACGEKNTSLANRKKIATANAIKNYTGTAAQNSQMLTLLKSGKLKKA